MKNKSLIIFLLSFLSSFVFGFFIFSSALAASLDVTASVSLGPVCGNNILEATEVCEMPSVPCPTDYNCVNCQCIPQGTGCTPGSTVCSWGVCENGNQTGTCSNGCTSWPASQACVIYECGNGTVDPGEECDDGNLINNDGCSALCQTEVGCGNGSLDPGEECDDGNLSSGDCCSALCQTELIISNVLETPNLNSAEIAWQTLCQSTISTIEWGKTPGLEIGSAGGLFGQNYLYDITGLESDVVYYYKITATAGTLSANKTGTFRTLGALIEICNNGLDDDNNGLIDIADPVCPCQAIYNCTPWEPVICPASQVQTRVCTKTNACWSNLPLPDTSKSCSLTCELTCQVGQTLDAINCRCLDIIPFCGNGICEAPQENPSVCPIDCPGCSSDWVCGEWEPPECPANNIQTRSCFDKNSCAIPTNPPQTQRTCGNVCEGLTCGTCQQINISSCICEELLPCCGNGVCEQGENNQSCPNDCIQFCQPSWTCSGWSECQNGQRTRQCTDLNNCNLNLNRPPEVTSCNPNCTVACGVCQEIDLINCRCLNTVPCCGNRVCESEEATWSCGVDCGLPPDITIILPQCLDGIDNDGDGLIDYPDDPSCTRPTDDSEESLLELVNNLRQDLNKVYKEQILDNPVVQAVNKRLAAPVLVTAVAVNAVSSVSFLNFLSYLRYLFSQPIALIARRKRAKWGIVYNSLTKQPIDLAIVRLYQRIDNRIVQSRVTDKQGRFSIMADPGEYYITVTKPNYNFPSVYLKDQKEDVKYLDLYFGQTIKVTEEKANITVNIPLDPIEETKPLKKIIFLHYLRRFQYAAAFSAVPLAAFSLLLSPTWLMVALLVFHLLLYILFRRLGYQRPPKSWGIVYDAETKTPIARAIARIYDKKYNKLLETRVTDGKGRYTFLVNNNIYYVTTEKSGYSTFKSSDIDLIAKDREAIVDLDINLKKEKQDADKLNIGKSQSEMPSQTKSQPQSTDQGVNRETLDKLLSEKLKEKKDTTSENKIDSSLPKTPEQNKTNNTEKSIFG